MGNAYVCDKCGKYFPGVPNNRLFPKEAMRFFSETAKGVELELCRKCISDFDTDFKALSDKYRQSIKKIQGRIKTDTGHESGDKK